MVEPAAKKRKVGHGPPPSSSTVRVGGKIISLDGYLNPPKAQKSSDKKKEERSQIGEGGGEQGVGDKENSGPRTKEQAGAKGGAAADGLRNGSVPGLKGKNEGWKGKGWNGGISTFSKEQQALPIWDSREEIREAARDEGAGALIIVGETGSGKSTQVPQFLAGERWCRGMIAITQPRRVAATTLAHRVAREVGTPLSSGSGAGNDTNTSPRGRVGYSVRFDHNVPRGTKIKFLTEGMLLQEILRDPLLRQYSVVVVDEVHERSVDVDLLLGFLRQIQARNKRERRGDPLRVVVMSATANVEKIQEFFAAGSQDEESGDGLPDREVAPSPGAGASTGARLLKIAGRQYPVDIIHTPAPVADVQEALLKMVFKIHLEEPLPGDILAFLTGQEEIEAVQRLIEEHAATLASNVPKVKVFPLFGQLSIEAQQQAFQPLDKRFSRKVVLATNIAETSVTVPGVRYVIDCGKAKVKQFRSRLGLESLLAKPVSKSSAIQRAGRAGREGPGKCYRLYTEATYRGLRDADLPEILRIDLLGAVLTMKARGVDDIFGFPFMDAPDVESLEKALVHLHHLGALADDGAITEMGRKMSLLPLSAPLGRVLVAAADPDFDCLTEAIDIVSVITAGDDIFYHLQSEEDREEVEAVRKELHRREGDLLTYLTTMQRYTAEPTNSRGEWCRARRINARNMRQALNIRRQLRALCLRESMFADSAGGPPPPDPQPFAPLAPDRAERLLRCFLRGFALRTAMLAPDGSYVTTQGKHVVAVHPSSVLHGRKKEAIMFLEHVFTQKNYARKVSVVQADWIAEALGGA